ncbi:MAG: hypothetical protein NVS9B4_00040 [Candidatus Acidiferrum sp.]
MTWDEWEAEQWAAWRKEAMQTRFGKDPLANQRIISSRPFTRPQQPAPEPDPRELIDSDVEHD